jgi:hypothetical protein
VSLDEDEQTQGQGHGPVKTEAETEVMWPQAKGRQEPPEARDTAPSGPLEGPSPARAFVSDLSLAERGDHKVLFWKAPAR